MSNVTNLFQYGMNEYYAFIPRDIFISFIIGIIGIGIYLSSNQDLRPIFGYLTISTLFTSIILWSPILFIFFIVSSVVGALLLHKSLITD